ncbi:hypothetical protein [Mesorhizobium sp. LNHC252B00]|uniref:hypothetical protein n=1 Tax=Mesorhizobium sp. LNHC252B00 TaxID=1287252 RepID=UPI00040B50DC|nr:hypothetical protein [Mesorhizobium sp. LNHC252B00]
MRTIAVRLPVLRTPKPRKAYNPIEQFFVKTKHLLGQAAGPHLRRHLHAIR